MNPRDCLASLELLRDFVSKVVPLEVYMRNLIVDSIENSNRRLWALRENMRIDEMKFAALFGVPFDEYHTYEKIGNPVPSDFLCTVAEKLSIPIDWLLCKRPMLPIPATRSMQATR
jgi:hypothetical protein